MSFAILYSEVANVFRAPLISTMASWAARASNLFGAVTKGKPVSLATAAATFVSKPTLELSPAKHKARVIIAATSLMYVFV